MTTESETVVSDLPGNGESRDKGLLGVIALRYQPGDDEIWYRGLYLSNGESAMRSIREFVA